MCGFSAVEPDAESDDGDEGGGDAYGEPGDFRVELVFFSLQAFLFFAKFASEFELLVLELDDFFFLFWSEDKFFALGFLGLQLLKLGDGVLHGYFCFFHIFTLGLGELGFHFSNNRKGSDGGGSAAGANEVFGACALIEDIFQKRGVVVDGNRALFGRLESGGINDEIGIGDEIDGAWLSCCCSGCCCFVVGGVVGFASRFTIGKGGFERSLESHHQVELFTCRGAA